MTISPTGRQSKKRAPSRLIALDALVEQPYGAALAVPLFVLDPGDVLFEPMLPLV
jgi:hypothetical protein